MNNFKQIVLIGWNTRNQKSFSRAVERCKDFGLEPILPNLYIGKLQKKNKAKVIADVRDLFFRKTDSFFHGYICQSCFRELDQSSRCKIPIIPSFEIFNFSNKAPIRKRKKSNKIALVV